MLTLPGNAYLQMKEDTNFLRLGPEFDGARLDLGFSVWTQYSSDNIEQQTIDLTGTVLAGRTSNPNEMRTLTTVRSDGLYYTNTSPSTLTMVGRVSAAALREVDEERRGGDLWVVLTQVRGVMVDRPPTRLHQTSTGNNLAVRVRPGDWAEELQKVTDASYIDILIPVTDSPDFAIAAGRVRKARDLIRRGEFNACAVELRQALDAVRAFYDTLNVHSVALSTDRKDRTEAQRFSIVVQGMYNWLTTFIHDDEESIKGCDMDRESAVQALAAVAGLLHRLAREQRAATV